MLRLERGIASIETPSLIPANGAVPAQPLIAIVKVNEVDRGEQEIYMRPPDDFLVPRSTLARWVRLPEDVATENVDGQAVVDLKRLHGARVRFDEQTVALLIVLPPELFASQPFDYQPGKNPTITAGRDFSALLDYSVGASSQSGATQWTVATEADLAYGGWSVRHEHFLARDPLRTQWLRGQTQVVRDDPARLTRFIAGDFVTRPTELTGPVALAGLSYGRAFETDPYFVQQPRATFRGVAGLPSDVDLFIGNDRVYHQHVAPGPFELANLNYLTGQRDIRVVVRDVFGRESTVAFPYYFADRGLAAGLHDFSYQAGVIRENAGTASFDYGALGWAATHRIGLSDTVTGGLHGEGTRRFAAAGPSVVLRMDRLGIASLNALASYERDGGNRGAAASFLHTFQRGPFSSSLSLQRATSRFAFLRPSGSQPLPERDAMVALTYSLGAVGTVGAAYRYLRSLIEPVSRTGSLSYALPFGHQWSLQANYRRTLGFGAGDEFFVGVQYIPRRDVTTSASFHGDRTGARVTSLQAGNVLPSGEGLGYRVAVGHETGPGGDVDTAEPDLLYRFRNGVLTTNGVFSSNASVRAPRAGAAWSGAVTYVGGAFGLSRPVDDGFAMVQIEPPLPDIRVYLNRQETGKTDANGRVMLPRVVSYVENNVALEDKDVPIDYSIAHLSQGFVPYRHAGVVVRFGVVKVRTITGVMRYTRSATPRPLAGIFFSVNVDGRTVESGTGSQGEVYLENIGAGSYPAEVEVEGHRCAFTLTVPPGDDPFVDLGEIMTCHV